MVISRMSVSRAVAIVWFGAVLVLTNPATSVRAQKYEGHELVQAELLAKTSAIVPGQSFLVGLHLRMYPRWHTYWKFPGDAGIPTDIKWKLPAGWKAGEIQWPIPVKLVEPGDIQIYGYQDEVLLLQEITPPASLADKAVQLSAEADWLVCEKICIPGGTNLTLDLPVAASATPANEEIFNRFQRTLPQPWPAADVASYDWSRSSPTEMTLRIKSSALANHPVSDFLPLPGDKVVVGHPRVERTPDGALVRIPVDTADAKLAFVPGLVVFGQTADGPDRNAWQLNAPSILSSTGGNAIRPATELGGLAKFLLFGFLGGFILNLMPCVLPVISLKIFGFIRHAGQSRRRILQSGLSFAAGIFVWFIGLAILLIVLKNAGREITWAFQFTNAWFVLGMCVVVLVFALNLFGVFEISLPQSASRGVLGWTAREGDAGSFFQGVFATVLATPCTAPFLGTALGFAFAQSPWMILVMFLAIAAGMAVPYVLLSAQPAWLKFLPKPGAWMERVKQLMGFLLMATLLFLLYVLGEQRGIAAVMWTSCFLLVVSLVCWMKGAFITPLATAAQRTVVFALMLVLVLGSGAYFIRDRFAATKLETAANAATTDGWQAFTPQKLEAELAQGHAVFVDFTAAWCVTCKFNESTVLESSSVREAFERRGIVKLKADWTNADPVITKILKQFGRPGVPLYVLYPAGKSAQPIILPELLTRNIVLEHLETIAPRVAAQ